MNETKGVAVMSSNERNLSTEEKDALLESRSDLFERLHGGDTTAMTDIFNLLGHKAINVSTQIIRE